MTRTGSWTTGKKKRIEPIAVGALSFPNLAQGLVGVSDKTLQDHLTLYQGYVAELAALDAARAQPTRFPPSIPSGELAALLASPVRDLALTVNDGQLGEAVAQVEGELTARGIVWRPLWYIGEPDFWTTDQATSINLPWYLASDRIWELVNEQDQRYTREEVVSILRHEVGHALGYAFEIWRDGYWKRTFGDFFAPYLDEYTPDPTSTDYVRHLHGMVSAANAHYAQKHADEDWAETFATWLDPGSRWREEYAEWPGALAKLETVETLLSSWGRAYGPPVNTMVGRRVPYTTLDYTVGEYLGVKAGPDPAEALLRRAPTVYDAVVLHELFFGGLARGAGVAGPGPAFTAAVGPGGFDGWWADFRAVARASTGWALAVWDARAGRVRNVLVDGHANGVPAGCQVLVALDCFDHAFAGDVGIRKDVYVASWARNVNWGLVDLRVLQAAPGFGLTLPVPPLSTPALVPTVSLVLPLRTEDPTVEDQEPLV